MQNVLIVGTDLKQIERVTARLTWGRVLLGGLLSGVWLGVFVGLIFSLFGRPEITSLLLFARLWVRSSARLGAAGYAFTRGQRDFTSVTQVVATRYEVLLRAQDSPGVVRSSPRWTRCARPRPRSAAPGRPSRPAPPRSRPP